MKRRPTAAVNKRICNPLWRVNIAVEVVDADDDSDKGGRGLQPNTFTQLIHVVLFSTVFFEMNDSKSIICLLYDSIMVFV